MLGAFTLLSHNFAIRDEAAARRLAEERDELERVAMAREAALIRFTLSELRGRADALGFVSIENPRFVRRGSEALSFAAHQ